MGPGERAEHARSRKLAAVLAVCGVVGGGLGAALALADPHNVAISDVARLSISPVLAVAMAIGIVVGLIAMPLYLFTQADEMKVRRNLVSMTGGCLAVLGLAPAWQMLAAGGLVPQPSALAIFALCYVVTIGTFLILQLRGRA